MAITVPTALVNNAPAFMFLRFLQGFFGSPVLATGGASIADLYDNAHTPIGLTLWSLACFVVPAIAFVLPFASSTSNAVLTQ
jgi:MFS transporter, DHA1 family, multidrug resistance protein